VNAGEVHSIMGPNGSGKSTLAQVLARREAYKITAGEIWLDGKDLLAMKPEEAACEGLFLAFQYPVEISGISNAYFLRSALNAIRKYRGLDEMDAMDFLPLYREKLKLLEMDEKLMNRSVNEGFSGGEKKRNEILQMAILEPKLAVLDETDSGLDIDALRIVAKGIEAMRSPKRAMVVVTHYQRLLNYILPSSTFCSMDALFVPVVRNWRWNLKRRVTAPWRLQTRLPLSPRQGKKPGDHSNSAIGKLSGELYRTAEACGWA